MKTVCATKKIKSLIRSARSFVPFVLLLVTGSAVAQFAGPTPLTLINGWGNSPYTTSIPTVEEVSAAYKELGLS